ncbi:MAG: hypothetical protein JNJ43_13135 [Anaerolineales bacterium]|nr:hypothetical protein [Anaerolineales bacterium]
MSVSALLHEFLSCSGAPDVWDSVAFSGFFLRPSGILLSKFYLRPPTRK